MKRFLFLLVLPLVGCASGGPGESNLTAAPQVRTVMSGSVTPDASGGAYSSTIRYSNEPVIVEEILDAPKEEVWPLLLHAYEGEGLVADGADPEAGILNLSRVEWSRTRNGMPLSTYLDCGPASTGRPLADDARIVASVSSQVVGQESGQSRVALRFEAMAYPFDASSGQFRACTTRGTLEREIIDRIQADLGPGPVGLAPSGTALRTNPTSTSLTAPLVSRDLPLEPGDQIRVWVASSIPLSGSFMGIRPDTLLLLRSRRTALPLLAIEAVQVRRTDRSSTVVGALIGIATGIALAMNTDLGIGGRHSIQGDILNPGLGALAGGLAGAAVGNLFIATSWEDIPWEIVRPGTSPASSR